MPGNFFLKLRVGVFWDDAGEVTAIVENSQNMTCDHFRGRPRSAREAWIPKMDLFNRARMPLLF